jgi:DNA-binding CsgD family transcriptional regulator
MDEFDPLSFRIPPNIHQVLAFRRQGYSNAAIGSFIGRSERDVEFILEEFDRLLARLPPGLRRVLLFRLEGHSSAEIANLIGRVERTVELKLKMIRAILRPPGRGDETH